jgi:small subunit ribosomal protein S17
MSQPKEEQDLGRARTFVARVVSDKMEKTVTVVIDRKMPHALYGKAVRRSTKLHAHDEKNAAKNGDIVVIKQARPRSRTKAWELVEVVRRSG